jgi:16S rRNA G966 N2-methylase RsmD
VIFLDPPYQSRLLGSVLEDLSASSLLEAEGWIVAEHFHKQDLPPSLPGLIRIRQIRHGQSKLSFYAKAASNTST